MNIYRRMHCTTQMPEDLESDLPVTFPELPDDHWIRILKKRSVISQAQAMLSEVPRILVRIVLNLHAADILEFRNDGNWCPTA